MAAREIRHHGLPVLDFFSADSKSRGEPMDRDFSALQQQVVKSPPVALSLRTRESSALALKKIFDQIYSSAESTPNTSSNTGRDFENKDGIDMHAVGKDAANSAFCGAKSNVSRPVWQASSFTEDPKMHMAEVDSYVGRNQQVFPSNNIGMGASGVASSFLQNVSFPAPTSQATSRPGSSNPSFRQPTAQLTIFYSGTVSVYDDVPADKANAIMLLAGTGHSSSMTQTCEGEKKRSTAKLSTASMNTQMSVHMSPVSPADATTGGKQKVVLNVPFIPQLGINTSPNSVTPSPLSSPAPSLPAESKHEAAPKRPHSGIELPHARKASLARFLEKRKDRIVVKQQQPAGAVPESDEKGGETARDERPSSPKKPCLTAGPLSSSPLAVKQQ